MVAVLTEAVRAWRLFEYVGCLSCAPGDRMPPFSMRKGFTLNAVITGGQNRL